MWHDNNGWRQVCILPCGRRVGRQFGLAQWRGLRWASQRLGSMAADCTAQHCVRSIEASQCWRWVEINNNYRNNKKFLLHFPKMSVSTTSTTMWLAKRNQMRWWASVLHFRHRWSSTRSVRIFKHKSYDYCRFTVDFVYRESCPQTIAGVGHWLRCAAKQNDSNRQGGLKHIYTQNQQLQKNQQINSITLFFPVQSIQSLRVVYICMFIINI